LPPSQCPASEPKGSTAENIVVSIKSRPPSGIMFAVFGAVKQFLTLLTLFSLEIYSWSKIAKNKANIVYSAGFFISDKSSGSRKKVSFIEKPSGVGRLVTGTRLRAANGPLTGVVFVTWSVVHS